MADEDRSPGRFILNSSERNSVSAPIHTGAGRFIQVRLRPMTLSERQGVVPAISFHSLAEQGIDEMRGPGSPSTPGGQLDAAVISGPPASRHLADPHHHETLRKVFSPPRTGTTPRGRRGFPATPCAGGVSYPTPPAWL